MTIPSPDLHAVWSAAAIHLWQTTLVLIPLFVLARLLRGAPAGVAHAVWTLCMVKLFLPFSLADKLAGGTIEALIAHLGGWLPHGGAAWLAPVAAVFERAATVVPGDGAGGSALDLVLASAWCAGASLLILHWVRRTPAGEGARLSLPPRLEEKLCRALRPCGIPRRVVRIVQGNRVPYVAGLLRPEIRIAEGLVDRFDPAELRSILLHEDAHRRRFDPLRGAFYRLAVLLFFYYPPLWAVIRRLRESGEMACDETAVKRGADRLALSRALAGTLHLQLEPRGAAAALGGGGLSLIRKRFRRLEEPGRYRLMFKHRLAVLGCAVFLIAGILVPVASSALIDSGGVVTPPKTIHMVKPDYPPKERAEGVEGRVVLRVTVEADGTVGEVSTVDEVPGHDAFTKSSRRAVKQWRFEAAKKGEKAIAYQVMVPFEFRLK